MNESSEINREVCTMMYHPIHSSASQAAEEKGQSHRLAACWDVGLLPEEAKSPVFARTVKVITGGFLQ